MKLINVLFMITLTAVLFSCEKEKNQSATLVRDCTGTYLRFDNMDYLVCNGEKTIEFEENDKVVATYKTVEECNSIGPICALYHKTEGVIKVCEIKNK